jgi:hypothetical protein
MIQIFYDLWSTLRHYVIVALFLVAVGGMLLSIYRLVVPSPGEVALDQHIHQLFESVHPLPGSKVVNSWSGHSWRQVDIGASYAAQADEQQIADNYRLQLVSMGWTYIRREKNLYYGRDYGGWSDVYCMGALQAQVDYAGAQASFGWIYGFGIGWGNNTTCR